MVFPRQRAIGSSIGLRTRIDAFRQGGFPEPREIERADTAGPPRLHCMRAQTRCGMLDDSYVPTIPSSVLSSEKVTCRKTRPLQYAQQAASVDRMLRPPYHADAMIRRPGQ